MSAEHQGSPPITEEREPTVPLEAPPVPGLRADFLMALRFFSRLPTGDATHEIPDLNRIALALPFASLVIGVGPAALLLLTGWLGLPSYFGAALAVGAAVLVGGAMSEDAIADSADGLFGGATAARRLEIMKDSRHGTYGVAALCLFLVLRIAALGAIAMVNPLAAAGLWLGASVMGRSCALWLAASAAPARTDGAGATAGQLLKRNFAVGAGFALLIGFVLAAPFAGLLGLGLGLAIGLATILGWTVLCVRLVGGQTGDLVGALVALLEIGLLTGFLAGL
ncbi:adenosylcobinamide-GDP ribazoletransferase [Devosia rhodophyticola]|uniref:Adenosylcobinamide-GDP ribazoletransferase n=1 Tax=Devosia rhodophyticola TaxID=3026423 RepID=A0ABY7YY98_9HYPH|nr:adenosylcobinamide-GDP ribazoletransferase [Devosia rhodophyticola]WDR06363.1 adenosylcobinamide-GDP ribazoletransferase [Devosia rhodophyticola]